MGDTIIEVLLSMSIIGLVLGSAFGIANRSVNVGQDAQERSEALKIAESQLEQFKSTYPKDSTIRARSDVQPFCFESSALSPVKDASDAKSCLKQNGSGGTGLYDIAIIPPSGASPTASYEVRITWDRLGANQLSDKNKLSLYYKVGAL